jgi:hypothetical protein
VRRLGELAARTVLGLELGLVALWVVLASLLSLIAGRVSDWNAISRS